MRLSHHHETTLDYCREFSIPLVPFPQYNEAAYVYVDGHPRLRMREYGADMRGYSAELLAKVVRKGELDQPLTKDDADRFIEYLRDEGRLDKSLLYPRHIDTSVDRTTPDHPRGYSVSVGTDGGPGVPSEPLELEALIQAGYTSEHPYDHDLNQQSTMLTPVGGMDRIPYAFADRLGNVIRYGAQVREVRRTSAEGVRVVFSDSAQGGQARELEGDFCICTLPPYLLARIPADFEPATVAALGLGRADHAGKVGLQFKRRFWEEDDEIYGGRSVTNLDIRQIYYPFNELNTSGKGVVIGAYHFSDTQAFDNQTPAAREQMALEQGAKIHPQYPAEFENSFSVEWHRVPHNEGSWMAWDKETDFVQMQKELTLPDGPFYFAGDWLSSAVAWQAGAFVAAHRTCRQVHARAMAG